jgi:hypothetical protein
VFKALNTEAGGLRPVCTVYQDPLRKKRKKKKQRKERR